MQTQSLRPQRFNNPLSIGRSSNTAAVFANSPLILQYKGKHQNIDIHKQIIKGFISYGKKHNLQKQSSQMCQILQKSIQSKDDNKIGQTCIHLYTLQSFLYKDINKCLRNAQFQNAGSTNIISDCYEKVQDLLPFCVLLHEYVLKQTRDAYEGVVYRGCNLSEEQVQEYKDNIHQHRQWNGFTSTTKNKQKVEKFGNVLFQIRLGQHEGSWGLHYGLQISKYSAFPNEEEVILFAGMQIYIESVKKKNNKYIITITCTDLGA